MGDDGFFSGLERVEVPWRGMVLHVPLHYRSMGSIQVMCRSELDAVRDRVPPGLHPLRWGLRRTVTAFGFNLMRDSDIGPYSEALSSIPVSIGEQAPPHLGLRSFARRGGALYFPHMVVTTEEARDLGVDISAYPKYLAEVEIDLDADPVTGVWREDGRDVLRVSCPRPEMERVGQRPLMHAVTAGGDRILRSTWATHATAAGSVPAAAVTLEFGDHPRAGELRALSGKCLGAMVTAEQSAALSSPVESLPVPPS